MRKTLTTVATLILATTIAAMAPLAANAAPYGSTNKLDRTDARIVETPFARTNDRTKAIVPAPFPRTNERTHSANPFARANDGRLLRLI